MHACGLAGPPLAAVPGGVEGRKGDIRGGEGATKDRWQSQSKSASGLNAVLLRGGWRGDADVFIDDGFGCFVVGCAGGIVAPPLVGGQCSGYGPTTAAVVSTAQ